MKSIYSIFDNLANAENIIDQLLQRKLIICANYWEVNSSYIWNGKIEKAKEIAVIFKLKKENYKTTYGFISQNHPYEVPFLASLKFSNIHRAYSKWMNDNE